MTVEAARRDPQLARFDLRRHRISAAGGGLSIVCVRSVDALLCTMTDRDLERGVPLPYWGDVWPVSVAIARALLRGPRLDGLRVLDVGCGVGTAGVAAGRMGAQVHFADLDERALRFAAFNARANGVACFSVCRFDWFREAIEGPFHRILCADVVYERRNHEPLLRQIRAGLAPGGTAVVGDPYRREADPFFEEARRRFRVEEEASSVHFEERRLPVRIAHLAHG